jgi:hypothetical protein
MPAFYRQPLSMFLDYNPDYIVGRLTSEAATAGFFLQLHARTQAWEEELETLKECVSHLISHSNVRSNWMGATTAPGWRWAVQPSPFLGESLRPRGSNSRHPFQPPHLQAAVGRYMNCQVRARLMHRSKLLRCRRTDADKDNLIPFRFGRENGVT